MSVIFSLTIFLTSNPVYSVFSLILAITFGIINLLILHVEFLAYIFFIVYVGAIALLFLFVVMLLNIKDVDLTVSQRLYSSEDSFIFLLVFFKSFSFIYCLSNILTSVTSFNFSPRI